MTRNFSVTEPHPTVPKSNVYLSGGRGGAGNYQRYKPEDLTTGPNAAGPASRIPLNKHYPRTIPIGRGGAGNRVTPEVEQSIFQFDEEMISRREATAPIYHVGRGGSGNLINENKPRTQRGYSHGSNGSTTSNESIRRSLEGVMNKLTHKLSRQ